MVGDSLVDYQTAAGAQARCCLVSYGFSHHTVDAADVRDAWIAGDTEALAVIVGRFVTAA